MIASFNQKSYPHTLIVIVGPDDGLSQYTVKSDVTRIEDENGKVIGYNFFHVDRLFDDGKWLSGQVELTRTQIAALNQKLESVGFEADLTVSQPTIVYGEVKTCVPHPDSDHLKITTVDVGESTLQQIVCGAPNIAQGQHVVVALPGTLMPNGSQIWPGSLRGVDSNGMICSARELGLPHAPQKRGILAVPQSFEPGQAFDPEKCDELLANGTITL